MGYPSDDQFEEARRHRTPPAQRDQADDRHGQAAAHTCLCDLVSYLDAYAFAKRNLADIVYNSIALGEEAGEVLGNIKKWMRDDQGFQINLDTMSPERRTKILTELGDVLFYWVYAVDSLQSNPQEVFSMLIQKISSRQQRGTQHGEGDDR